MNISKVTVTGIIAFQILWQKLQGIIKGIACSTDIYVPKDFMLLTTLKECYKETFNVTDNFKKECSNELTTLRDVTDNI